MRFSFPKLEFHFFLHQLIKRRNRFISYGSIVESFNFLHSISFEYYSFFQSSCEGTLSGVTSLGNTLYSPVRKRRNSVLERLVFIERGKPTAFRLTTLAPWNSILFAADQHSWTLPSVMRGKFYLYIYVAAQCSCLDSSFCSWKGN